MAIIPPKKFKTREAAETWVDSLSVLSLRELAIDMLMSRTEQPAKISITREAFEEHFRFIGDDNRGRPRKS